MKNLLFVLFAGYPRASLLLGLATGIIFGLTPCQSGAQSTEPLLQFADGNRLTNEQQRYFDVVLQEPTTVKARVAFFSNQNVNNSILKLPLPDGREILAERQEQFDRAQNRSWIGRCLNTSGEIHLVQNGDMLTGHLEIEGQIITIRPLTGGMHAVIEYDGSQQPPCEARKVDPEHENQPGSVPKNLPEDVMFVPASSEATEPNTGNCRIRLIVAYTTAVGSALADPNATIINAIDLANTGYANSGVNHRVELARSYETTYTEHSDQRTNLQRWRGIIDGYMDDVHFERLRWQADMCALLTNNGSGIAYVSTSYSWVFSVTNYSYIPNLTFHHELGHNHGSDHDPANALPSSSAPAFGYGDPGGCFRTVMAYQSACGTFPCSRVNQFSNPSVNFVCGGSSLPTGTSTQNNVSVHNSVTNTLINHRVSPLTADYSNQTIPDDETAHAVARSLLSSSGSFIYENGSEGTFRAGNCVTLRPGFEARSGTVFCAFIENCSGPSSKLGEELAIKDHHNHEEPEVYPNPGSDWFTFRYHLDSKASVELSIYNLLGQPVDKLAMGLQEAGEHKIEFSAQSLPQGQYLYVMQLGEKVYNGKLILTGH